VRGCALFLFRLEESRRLGSFASNHRSWYALCLVVSICSSCTSPALDTLCGRSAQGVDLSPYFLAVAQFRDRQAREAGQPVRPIRWMHARGESTGLPDGSADLVSLAFLVSGRARVRVSPHADYV
jgi:hypothetical protein